MAFKNYRTYCSSLLLILITCQSIYIALGTTSKSWGLKHKGTIKTIETEAGEIIDCVDIYKQPAFDNPLIKNLRREPSNYPFGNVSNSNLTIQMLQDWDENEECPEGTIPIRRDNISNDRYQTKSPPPPLGKQRQNSGHEYAIVTNQGSSYYGASGSFNIWNPKIESDSEFSLSQMWVISSYDQGDFYNNLNSLEVGWMVLPKLFGDRQTRFFIYWTRDGYKSTGCYNLYCGGFVQTSRKYSLGMPFRISKYGGQGYETSIHIFKDKKGDWWLQLLNEVLGYWPGSILTGLKDHANLVEWGGEVVNDASNNHHTSTQMGSGEFPFLGFSKSCFISNLKVLDTGFVPRDPGYVRKQTTRPECYDITLTKNKGTSMGTHIFFGGPGFSPKCQ